MTEPRTIELQVVAMIGMAGVAGALVVRCSCEIDDRLGAGGSGCKGLIVG